MTLSEKETKDLEYLLDELKQEDVVDGFEEVLKSIDTYINIYSKPQYDILSVKHDNTIIAFCVGEQKEEVYHIVMSYVGREHRRKGLGLQMKNEMINKAKQRGCNSIYSIVRSDNKNSYNMNIKAGWEVVRAWYKFQKDI